MSEQGLKEQQRKSALGCILAPIQKQLVGSTLLSALGAILSLLPLALIAWLIQGLYMGMTTHWVDHYSNLMVLMVVAVGSLLLGVFAITAAEFFAHLADHRITAQLQQQITLRLTQVPLGWFSARSAGEVKQAMQDDISSLHSLTAHFYPAVGRAFGTLLIAAFYLFVLDWRLALLSFLPFLGFLLFLRHAMKSSTAHMGDFAAHLGQMNSATVELTQAIPVVKTFAQTGQATIGYQQAVQGFAQAFREFTRPLVKSMAHAHAMVAPVTVLGVVIFFATVMSSMGWMQAIEVVPFVLIAPAICAPVLLLHTLLHDLQGSQAAAQRILDLLDTPSLVQLQPNQTALVQDYTVQFEQVSYAYTEQSVLNKIELCLRPGTVTAIVGPSGAGKSTLAQLLLRFFDPTEGTIRLGGVDIRHIDSCYLYQHLGFVLQETKLIHATIAENIALGRAGATQSEIETAARAANIHERIMSLPKQYQSVLGADLALSGGERQRISIARAILLDPPILILDEATAAADIENEIAIQQALARFAHGRTLLVIAHRLDTIIHADQIVVLDQGHIVEQGKHDELLIQNGRYAQLWIHRSQQQMEKPNV
ncbi:ABC transporter ATP-binding protein [Acinetobacter rudis]|uniref:ABC transporter ATP-binding protein n=1 Tax=Acinetobacter rudis TaxID=632955 RepID=UPI00280CBD30|nr:ABC transporter ATP-binding protein [Acinetobacter rudis]MDQ8952356.1 ABC transporter ATP-binding protein [Acinetobacter rudis]